MLATKSRDNKYKQPDQLEEDTLISEEDYLDEEGLPPHSKSTKVKALKSDNEKDQGKDIAWLLKEKNNNRRGFR